MKAVRFCVLAFALASVASANADGNSGLSGTLTLTSDYRIRGVSQNNRELTPEGEIDWNGENGWSLAARAFKVDFEDHQHTSLEPDFLAGRQFILDGTTLLVQATYYAYPDHSRAGGAPRYSLFEAAGTASHTWGPWTPSVFVAWSPDYFGESGSAEYVALGLTYQFNDWLSFSANAGEQWIGQFDGVPQSGVPYTNWDFGFTATHGAFSLDVRYAATSLSHDQCLLTQGGSHWCEAGVIATLSYAIGQSD
jgi:uncharacterized protein (TIGR02001 family)